MSGVFLGTFLLFSFQFAERENLMTIIKDCFEVEKNILRALAVGFRIHEDHFLPMHTKPDNQLRLAHYPRFVFV